MIKKNILFVFYAHVPYIPCRENISDLVAAPFYDLLSYSLLPFLRMCNRLDTEGVPFKCVLVISPLVCEMLKSSFCCDRYIAYLDRHIAFAQQELTQDILPSQKELTTLHRDMLMRNRDDFAELYQKDVLKQINKFAAKQRFELMATSATPCFFPFYQDIPEVLAAQLELGLHSFRETFEMVPSGFWFPAMGYSAGLDHLVKSYGIDYTILESQSFLFADHPPAQGVFSAAVTENGLAVLGKDTVACADIEQTIGGFYTNPLYLDTAKDIGFERDGQGLSALFNVEQGRRATGFCYCSKNGKEYNPAAGKMQADRDAEQFIAKRHTVFEEAAALLDGEPLCSVCVLPFTFLGKTWFEGICWLESVFRKLASVRDMECSLPSDYLKKVRRIQSIEPFYASHLPSGYADELLNSTNDWMFPRIQKAAERMIDLAGRFPDDQGLKERTLNMAAKEVLLAQSLDWPLMVDAQIFPEYAAEQYRDHIDTFTAVYEALGADSIGTERLIKREKEYPIFKEMNYRFFAKATETAAPKV